MAYREEWSDEAKEALSRITGHLLQNWSEKQALAFIEKVHSIVGFVLQNPEIGRASAEKKKLRKFVINKKVTLVYQIKPKRTIRVVTLLDNRQKPGDYSF